jgi:hypothetical protein
METLLSLIKGIGDFGQTVVDYFNHVPSWFEEIFVYLNAWYIKIKFYFLLVSLELSYKTAQFLLNEIGFTELVVSAFNALPSELRFYAFLFQIPQALNIYFTCMATGFVIRMTRF